MGAVRPQKFGAFEAYTVELGTVAAEAIGIAEAGLVWNIFEEYNEPVEYNHEVYGDVLGAAP